MATNENRKYVKGLIEALESRVHGGPPVHATELVSAREYLQQSEFSPASHYFNRLEQIKDRLQSRAKAAPAPSGRRNYGGEAGGYWMQLQSAYDHVILSTCYDGEFNRQRGRVKISHRFNQEGRIDFVELKFLRSLNPVLNGALRKLVTVKDYQDTRKDWLEAEAFVLEVLPRELVFLYEDIFRTDRSDMVAWLINIGHRLTGDLVKALREGTVNGESSQPARNPDQLRLADVGADEVASPILEQSASLESTVEIADPKSVIVRYHSV